MVTTPSACPVVTGSSALESRSKASPLRRVGTTGRPSSSSWKTSRRLAASARANAAIPARVGRRRAGSGSARSTGTAAPSPGAGTQLHPASDGVGAAAAAVAPSDDHRAPVRSKPSAVPQARQPKFSKNTSCRQDGAGEGTHRRLATPAASSRDGMSTATRHARSPPSVKITPLQRRDVGVVPAVGDLDVGVVDEPVVGRVDVEPAGPGEHRRPGVRGVGADQPFPAGRRAWSPGSR